LYLLIAGIDFLQVQRFDSGGFDDKKWPTDASFIPKL